MSAVFELSSVCRPFAPVVIGHETHAYVMDKIHELGPSKMFVSFLPVLEGGTKGETCIS